MASRPLRRRFNPTKVRLKAGLTGQQREGGDLLQPHKGSSESDRFRRAPAFRPRFNPTKVRLKASESSMSGWSVIGFNPTKVRLKVRGGIRGRQIN